MKNLLIVSADTNDADYVYNITEVSNESLDQIIGIVKKINEAKKSNFYGFPWGKGEFVDVVYEEEYDGILTDDEMEFLNDFVPYGEHGIHTVSKIEVYRNIGDKENIA